MIRIAAINDLEKIEKLYSDVLDYEEIHHYSHWQRDIYPTKQTALNAINNSAMYIGEDEDGNCYASVVFNKIQAPEYKKLNWTYEATDDEVLTVHTLCVSPFFTKQGKGKEILDFAHELGKNLGCKYIRLDTHQDNTPAFNLYIKYGFDFVGETEFYFSNRESRILRCLEKKI